MQATNRASFSPASYSNAAATYRHPRFPPLEPRVANPETAIIGGESKPSKPREQPLTPNASKVSVIIPTWKRADLLKTCLESLQRQTFSSFEVIIVSNGAGSWAQELAREFHSKLIDFPANRGFAAAVNAGIDASRLPIVMILNDDVELDQKWLEKTVAILEEDTSIAFLCGKIYQSDGRTIDDAGNALSMAGAAWRLGHGRPDSPSFDQPRPLFAVSMTAALFRRSVFEIVGSLDEHFVSYLEDVDFSIRLSRSGLRGLYLPQAVARHHGGASSGGPASPEVFRLMTRNQSLLRYKHFPWPLSLRLLPRICWSQLLWSLMAVRQGKTWACLRGSWSALRAWPRIRKQRHQWLPVQLDAFFDWLRTSERAIYEEISTRPRKEQDTYWRMYFSLFRPPSRAVSMGGTQTEQGTEGLPRRSFK